MKITKAGIEQADIVGQVHSEAWKQAYADIFPKEFLDEDTPEKRKHEFIDSCGYENIFYYIIYEDNIAVGIVKVADELDTYEIASFYILEQYRNKGYGKQVVAYLEKELDKKRIRLWVLDGNIKARRFYENNGFVNTGTTRIIYRGDSFVQLQYESLEKSQRVTNSIAISSNRVEGMAIGKISGLFGMLFFVPLIVTGTIRYVFCLFPMFWIGEWSVHGGGEKLIIAFLNL